jgi:hypothetical protein
MLCIFISTGEVHVLCGREDKILSLFNVYLVERMHAEVTGQKLNFEQSKLLRWMLDAILRPVSVWFAARQSECTRHQL